MTSLKLLLFLWMIMPMRTLESYVGHNRVLLVFGKSPSDARVDRQFALLAQHSDELQQRDVVVLRDLIAKTDRDNDAWREKYHVGPAEFMVVLLGKDGGEKLRQSVPITIQKLSAVIDAMPMRQDEMKTKK